MRKISKARNILLFLIILSILLSGCWSRRELEDLAFILALGIDREGDEFIIYGLVGEPVQGQFAEGDEGELTVLEGRGKTISAAYDHFFETADRRPFLSHIKIVIFSEEIARDSIKRSVDFLRKDIRIRGNTIFMVAQGDLKEILETEPNLGEQPGLSIEESIRFNQERSKIFKTQLFDLVRDLKEEDIEPIMPMISKDDEKIAIRQGAFFQDTVMKGIIDSKEVLGLLWLRGEVQHGIFTVNPEQQPGNYITFQIMQTKVSVNPVINSDNDLIFHINITQNLILNDNQSTLSVSQMEQEAEKYIKNTVLETVNSSKESGIDYIGFGKRYRRKYPDKWNSESWQQQFKESNVIIKVDTLINTEER